MAPEGFIALVAVALLHCAGGVACEDAAWLESTHSACTYWRYASRATLAYFMIAASLLRRNTKMVNNLLIPIVPPPLPARACVYLSGIFEAMCGVLLLVPSMERQAAWLIIALLAAVFPANIYHALSRTAQKATRIGPPACYVRVPIQFVFLGWARWHTL
jgi:uncharacterized membrane protein